MFPYKDPAATDLLATAIGIALAATGTEPLYLLAAKG